MIESILGFILLNFLTFKLNKKIMRDYAEVRKPLKIKNQTWGSFKDPDYLYALLAIMLMLNMVYVVIMLGAGHLLLGSYVFVILATYIVIGLLQLYFNLDEVVDDCKKISLKQSEYSLNIFWQIIINLICTMGGFIDVLIKKLGFKIPNPIPSITEKISKGKNSFNE